MKVLPVSDAADAPANILMSWGDPKVVLCTHLDTVPPYIAPTYTELCDGDILIQGRGSCDAKGQIISMYKACVELVDEGVRDIALLLLYGEETGSYGAKAYRSEPGAEYVVVGEPTDNKMARASKGTKSFRITIKGKKAHSGYPEHGASAVERFIELANVIRAINFPYDDDLGYTTYNIGELHSDNPQNILSDRLTCRIYFRTTFATDAMVSAAMEGLQSDDIEIEALGGDSPSRYVTVEGMPQTVVSFGSDAPQLSNFRHKSLCGPGSILVAHTADECIKWSEIELAVEQYKQIVKTLLRRD